MASAERALEERYLAGLRERRLFSLAEAYCRQKMAEANAAESETAFYVGELVRTVAAHARNVPPAEREAEWRQAAEAAAWFRARFPDGRHRLLVDVQEALVLLTRGELERQQAELAGNNEAMLDAARQSLREAIRRLEELTRQAAEELRNVQRQPRGAAWSADELFALHKNLQLQTARGLRNQALSYPAGSQDRVAALGKALEALGPLVQMTTADAIVWQARVDQALCERLLERYDVAERRLASIDNEAAPPPYRAEVQAERIRLASDRKQYDQLPQLLRAATELTAAHPAAELDLAIVEACVTLWQRAGGEAGAAENAEEAARWQQAALAGIANLERRHGRYWLRRGEALLSRAGRGQGAGGLEVLRRLADTHYRRGQLDEALAAYDDGAEQAAALGNAEEQFRFALAAAAIERRRERHGEAAERLETISRALPNHPDAAETHLAAIVAAAQRVQKNEYPLDRYKAMLAEHRRAWPQSPTADTVALWLGNIERHGGRYPEAIAAYKMARPESPEHFAALEALRQAYAAHLRNMQSEGNDVSQATNEAALYFEDVILGADNRIPERWTPAQRLAATAAADLRLRFSSDGYAAAEAVLAAALNAEGDAARDWRDEARGLLLVAQAGGGKIAAARQMLHDLGPTTPAFALRVSEGLYEFLRQQRAAAVVQNQAENAQRARQATADLLLTVLDAWKEPLAKLDPAERTSVARYRAAALHAAGKRADAAQLYAALRKEFPQDGDLHEAYAQVLSEGNAPEDHRAALAAWREVLARAAPQSERWFRAKYAVAFAHYQLNDREQAAKMIRLTQTLHPDLGGPAMKRKFEALLRECE